MKDENMIKLQLKNNLLKLNKEQLKMFFGMLVHYWVKYKSLLHGSAEESALSRVA